MLVLVGISKTYDPVNAGTACCLDDKLDFQLQRVMVCVQLFLHPLVHALCMGHVVHVSVNNGHSRLTEQNVMGCSG